jgi:hypothetical protein
MALRNEESELDLGAGLSFSFSQTYIELATNVNMFACLFLKKLYTYGYIDKIRN